jgi:hypothetical protein
MSLTLRAVKGTQLTQAEMDANLAEIGYISASIVAAGTTDLSTATGQRVPITGTTTITSFGTAAPIGTIRVLRFASAGLTLTQDNTNLMLPFGVNWITRAGDILTFQKELAAGSGGWRCIAVSRGLSDGTRIYKLVQFVAQYDNGSLGATPTINPMNGASQKGTTSANITTFTVSAPTDNLPTTIHLDIIQGATARTLTIGSPATPILWKSGADKALTAVIGARDHMVLFFDGTSWIADLMKGIA